MKAYDIKIRLDKVKPNCWRDLIIPAGISFDDLAFIAQRVFGFYQEHDYEFFFKDLELKIEGLGEGIPLHYIEELDDYYVSMNYNLGYEYEIDYFFDNYKKIKLEVYTRDKWYMLIEVKKIVESDVPYPLIKRYKGDYNPLERSCDRGDFIDFLYLLEHPEKMGDDYFEKAVAFWDDFEKFDKEKTQDLLEKAFENYFSDNSSSTPEVSGKYDDINILPSRPTNKLNIDSTLYEAKLIGKNDSGSVYLHEPFHARKNNKKVAFITGINPIESQAYRAVFEAIKSPLSISFTSFYMYHINYNKSVDKEKQREIGEKLAKEFIVPHIIENDYMLIIDVHSNTNENSQAENNIFAITGDEEFEEYVKDLSSQMLKNNEYESYTNPSYIKDLIDNNQKVTYFETDSYQPPGLTYTITSNLMKTIDMKVYEEEYK